ncbi:hypothetical protein HAX54_017617 [Datura stramonium]|uniref:PHD finger protein MALE STERILITY 1-like ubiquitin-like domain-containing protein n=1 Tax=Datura stramonium TaxID=4076 RepID=A0ABS8UKZ6_DATST|nr:hypothetical protein [Datura stramonium]
MIQELQNCDQPEQESSPRDDPDDSLLRFICCILPSSSGLEAVLTKGYPPGELVEVPLHSTIGDLKIAIESAMRDTYCIMDNLMVTDVVGMEQMGDYEVLFGITKSGSELWVRGFGLDLDSELKNEGGSDNWTVKCRCGARDDDGERMVSCDICRYGILQAVALRILRLCHHCLFVKPAAIHLHHQEHRAALSLVNMGLQQH